MDLIFSLEMCRVDIQIVLPKCCNVQAEPGSISALAGRRMCTGVLGPCHQSCQLPHRALHYGKQWGLNQHLVEAHFDQLWSTFERFLVVNWTRRHMEAFLPASYTWVRPLEPKKGPSNLPSYVAGDVGLGSHCALPVLPPASSVRQWCPGLEQGQWSPDQCHMSHVTGLVTSWHRDCHDDDHPQDGAWCSPHVSHISDVITDVTKLATNGYKRCNSIN